MLVGTTGGGSHHTEPSAVCIEGERISRPLRVLVFSTLYPSAVRFRHGIFVETRLRQLLALGGVETRVVAPVPWFPSEWRGFGSYAALAATPHDESRFGVEVIYPRYPVIPKVGMLMQPDALAWTGLRAARALQRDGFDFDVIDAHYFYPDGVAASKIAARLAKPFVVTARGSDLNLIPKSGYARSRIVNAANHAARVICVSEALRQRAIEIGIDAGHVEVLRNGVDTTLFQPLERGASRTALGLPPSGSLLLLSVGNLVPDKGHALAIDALAGLPNARLLLIGDGPERGRLLRRAKALGIETRLDIRPAMPQEQLSTAYSAADMLVLTSLREGWPNVLLEAIACGTPVVATNVGGVSEIIGGGIIGRVVDSRNPESLCRAINDLVRTQPGRDDIRRHAIAFEWKAIAERYRDVLRCAAERRAFADTLVSGARVPA